MTWKMLLWKKIPHEAFQKLACMLFNIQNPCIPNFWQKKLFHKLMLYFNDQFCSSLKSCDNLHKNDCGEISRSDVDDTYSDLGGSGTGVHGVSTEIYRRWGHQRLTSSSVRQLLIGGICKENHRFIKHRFFILLNCCS